MGSYYFEDADESRKKAVWEKGTPHSDQHKFPPSVWRSDICGSWMKYSDHGNTGSGNGWQIDHIFPTAKGGKDDLSNLQPLNWKNNQRKGDTYPWSC